MINREGSEVREHSTQGDDFQDESLGLMKNPFSAPGVRDPGTACLETQCPLCHLSPADQQGQGTALGKGKTEQTYDGIKKGKKRKQQCYK